MRYSKKEFLGLVWLTIENWPINGEVTCFWQDLIRRLIWLEMLGIDSITKKNFKPNKTHWVTIHIKTPVKGTIMIATDSARSKRTAPNGPAKHSFQLSSISVAAAATESNRKTLLSCVLCCRVRFGDLFTRPLFLRVRVVPYRENVKVFCKNSNLWHFPFQNLSAKRCVSSSSSSRQ